MSELSSNSATGGSEGRQATVIGAFHQACDAFAERVAASDGQATLTYRALDEKANRLAVQLEPQIDGGRRPLAILTGHRVSGLVAMLAVLKLGCPFAFLPPRGPQQMKEMILQSVGARVLLTDTANIEAAAQLAGVWLPVVNVEDSPGDGGGARIEPTGAGADVVSIHFTSGSTGRPKGVTRTNQGHLVRLEADRAIYREGPGSRLALLRTMNFSATSGTIFNALLNGAALHLAQPEAMSTEQLAAWLVAQRISSLRMPTPLLRQMVEAMPEEMCLVDLRFCRPSGRLLRSDVEQLWPHLPESCELFHALASAETSLVTCLKLQRDALPEGEVIPVGRPAPGVEVSLLSEAGDEVAEGETGRLVVSSSMVTPGYWNDGALTEARITADAHNPARITFLTGDLLRRRADGLLAFAGRADHQVKIRGFRVEMEAVEAALEQQPGVVQAALKRTVDATGETTLTGYVEMERGALTTGPALRRALTGSLPDYMIPTRIIRLEQLPTLGTSGNVNRAALPDPGRERPELAVAYVAPASATEIELAAVWSELLGIEAIGVEDSFFDLGGQSLLAAQLVTTIRRRFGVDLPIAAVFQAETMGRLAAEVDRLAAVGREMEPVNLEGKLRLLGF